MSAGASLVDWRVAERTAGVVIGGIGPIGRTGAPDGGRYSAGEVEAACCEAIELAADYAGLGAVTDPPVAELVDRRSWARGALCMLAEAAWPVEERLGVELNLPGPLGGLARGALGAAAGAEAGAAVGYAARRVLAQYDIALFSRERQARLLFVAENMDKARRDLDADRDLFLAWVALHETAHVVQFERVPWLAGHLRELAGELIEGAVAGLRTEGLLDISRRLLRDPRELLRAAMRGGLARALADPGARATLDRLQATMSVIEGHAEHLMDAASPALAPGLAELRRRLDQRRARRGGLGDAVGRLLGMDLKLRQYALGKAFCDGVVEAGGAGSLRLVWRSPEDLPDLDELERPRSWLARVTRVSRQPA